MSRDAILTSPLRGEVDGERSETAGEGRSEAGEGESHSSGALRAADVSPSAEK